MNCNRYITLRKNKEVNIVFVCDEKYFMPTCTSLMSLIFNKNISTKYNIYIIISNVTIKQKQILKKLISNFVNIEIINIESNYTKYKINKEGFHVSPTAIVKFEIPNILHNIEKVIYLDSDVIVRHDLCELFSYNLDSKYAGVISDIKPVLKYKPSILKKLKIENHRLYFNSGVMLLNLKMLRECSITDKLFQYRENGINFFMDQDAFNVVFEDNVLNLSLKYNFLTTLVDEYDVKSIVQLYEIAEKAENFSNIVNSVHILHFASKNKPWNCATNFDYEWHKYDAMLHNKVINKQNEVQTCDYNIDYIVSLTSYPKRIRFVYYTIKSILMQNIKVKKIVLWLAHDEFPNGEDDLPNRLLLLKEKGLEILWCENLRSYKKLIPALKLYRNKVIITIDDDIIYPKNWLKALLTSYLKMPNCVHCHRAHRIQFDKNNSILPYNSWQRNIEKTDASFFNFFTGCGGVLYPPNILSKNVFNELLFLNICNTGDDIWFWAMCILNKIRIKVVDNKMKHLLFVLNSQDESLWKTNVLKNVNDEMLGSVIRHFPEILDTLKND